MPIQMVLFDLGNPFDLGVSRAWNGEVVFTRNPPSHSWTSQNHVLYPASWKE